MDKSIRASWNGDPQLPKAQKQRLGFGTAVMSETLRHDAPRAEKAPGLHMTRFDPPRRTLMGPGPSDVHQRVLDAMARPTIGHLDPAFVGLMDEICDLLRKTFRTDNALTFPVSGPGSVAMEACFVNLLEPGDTIIVCANGVFGEEWGFPCIS